MPSSSAIIRKFERFLMAGASDKEVLLSDEMRVIGVFKYDLEAGAETYTSYIDNTVTVTQRDGMKTVTPSIPPALTAQG